MCESQAEAERKARTMSSGQPPVLHQDTLSNSTTSSYLYHPFKCAKCLVRGQLVTYEFCFPGLPSPHDLLLLQQRRDRMARRKHHLMLLQQQQQQEENGESGSDGGGTEAGMDNNGALFHDDNDDYDLIDGDCDMDEDEDDIQLVDF